MKPFRRLLLSLFLVAGLFACKTQKTAKPLQGEKVSSEQPKSIKIRGTKLHYIRQGTGEPLIFIHGSIGDYRAWISRMEDYSKDYDVIAYSRRYAYPNEKVFDESADYSVRIHADDLYELIKKLGLKKVNIVAHSYGAFTALLMALDHPEVVKSLVLGEPPVRPLTQTTEKGRESWAKFLKENLDPAKQDFIAKNNEAALEHFVQGVMGDEFQLSQAPIEVKQGWMDNLSELWGISMNADFPPIDDTAIRSLELPVLLLVGDNSPSYLPEISSELHRLLPQSEIVQFKNMSHGLYFEQPKNVDRAVMDFLDGIE